MSSKAKCGRLDVKPTVIEKKPVVIKSLKYLLLMLAHKGTPHVMIYGIHPQNGEGYYRGVLQSVSREDGSGRCFNVQLLNDGYLFTLYVRFK